MLLVLSIVSLAAIAIYAIKLRRIVRNAPTLSSEANAEIPTVTVIVPAYNEAVNIQDCIASILDSTDLGVDRLQVRIVDDGSTDDTLEIARTFARTRNDDRLQVIPGKPRPQGEVWVGKNWACTQAAETTQSEFILFVDADVRLEPGAIEATVREAVRGKIDLLTGMPKLVCGCFAEWAVQPILFNTLSLAYDFSQVNDPDSDSAFAAGPFMLFRRQAYEQLGGHRAVAAEIVEDVELARRVKQAGLRLSFLPIPHLARVRMYRSWGELWEGWTKNFYQGSDRNLSAMVYTASMMGLIYLTPWLLGGWEMWQAIDRHFQPIDIPIISLAFVGIAVHHYLRRLGEQLYGCPTLYWWLAGLGGSAVAAIALGSAIKTETGWGWTWRGRSLAQ
ncbi:MAG: glycosyltransferase family 2 protein [Cyanobacteriota bacterium]|nr:glycosyltransferase family 2 protein [Cyanobacteriota bacterium]